MYNNPFSQKITVFHGRVAPEEGFIAGYAALLEKYGLRVPMPEMLTLISLKNRNYVKTGWRVLSPRYQPGEDLYKQLVFALKYEGINLLVLKKLFGMLSVKEIERLVTLKPTGQYSRKLWFLYEWLSGAELNIPDLTVKNYVPLVDTNLQYTLEQGENSSRHRIINNLPGTVDFCPLIFKTKKLDQYLATLNSAQSDAFVNNIHKDILRRASAFLFLKDSKASFSIEGESPGTARALRWGKAIGQAGAYELTKEELLRLQQILIDDTRFTKMGFRKSGGFVGEHDRESGAPIPDHIAARCQDLDQLINGLTTTSKKMEKAEYSAVLAAASIAFGFVFIHPFVDGNGRIHRYIIHHILSKFGFVPRGFVFPISASILEYIHDYRQVLESYSHPLLEFIEWRATEDNNVEVLNETADYYKYFDATRQAEFLYDCIRDTIDNIIPAEVEYLKKFDEMKRYLENLFDMPDKEVSTLIRFLEQNEGKLSKRVKTKEFSALEVDEIKAIENKFNQIFKNTMAIQPDAYKKE